MFQIAQPPMRSKCMRPAGSFHSPSLSLYANSRRRVDLFCKSWEISVSVWPQQQTSLHAGHDSITSVYVVDRVYKLDENYNDEEHRDKV